jgi:hypothetical protein
MLSEAKHPVLQLFLHHLQIRVLHHQRFFASGAEVDFHLLRRVNHASRYIVNIIYGVCLKRFVSINYSEFLCFVILNEVKNPVS